MTDPDDKTLLDELFGEPAGTSPDTTEETKETEEPEEPGDKAPPARRTASAEGPPPARASAEPARPTRAAPAWPRPILRRAEAPGCREIGLTTAGFVLFVSVDSIMMYAPFRMAGATSLLPQAITLVLLAFGLGSLMIWSIRGAWRPVGVGMMIGWVFMTLISAGFFTGLNP
jgi:hypothetical protein